MSDKQTALSQKLASFYARLRQLEQVLAATPDPAQQAILRRELDECFVELRRLEIALHGLSPADVQGIVRRYLENVWPTLLAYDRLTLPRPDATPPTFQPNVWLNFVKSADVLPPFLTAEGAAVSLESLITEHTRGWLVGPGGSGKSASLRYLFNTLGAAWFNPSAPETEARPLPLLLDGASWAETDISWLDFLQRQVREAGGIELAGLLPQLLKSRSVMLLFDNFDELPPSLRETWQAAFLDWPEVRLVATAQPGFKAANTDQVVNLPPFTPAQVEHSARAFWGDEAALTKGLLTALFESDPARPEMARPFYLPALLGYYYQERQLPPNPARLLQALTEKALLSPQLQKTLANMALWLLLRDERGLVSKSELASHLFSWGKMAKADQAWQRGLNSGLLREEGDRIGFTHRLWQEYFNARGMMTQSFNVELLRFGTPHFKGAWRQWAELTDESLPAKLAHLRITSSNPAIQQAINDILGYLSEDLA